MKYLLILMALIFTNKVLSESYTRNECDSPILERSDGTLLMLKRGGMDEINYYIEKYFHKNGSNDIIYKAEKLQINFTCVDNKNKKLYQSYPINSDSIFPICVSYNIKKVKDVLLFVTGCGSRPVFAAHFSLNIKRNIDHIATRLKGCSGSTLSVLAYIQTVNDTVYAKSFKFKNTTSNIGFCN